MCTLSLLPLLIFVVGYWTLFSRKVNSIKRGSILGFFFPFLNYSKVGGVGERRRSVSLKKILNLSKSFNIIRFFYFCFRNLHWHIYEYIVKFITIYYFEKFYQDISLNNDDSKWIF